MSERREIVDRVDDAHGNGPSEEPLALTVTALLQEARRMLEEERQHGESLDTRLGQLTAFAGVILVLVAPSSGSVFDSAYGTLFDVFHLGSVLLLAGSALLAVTVWIRTRIVRLGGEERSVPWRRIGVEDEVLDKFSGEFTAEPTVQIERRMIATTVEGIKDQRDLNGKRWNVLRLVGFALASALVAVAVQAFILVFAW
jgi:hypothetical protein